MSLTHFGHKKILTSEKSSKVQSLFDNVAQHYDVMNDLMSFGAHRLWKYITVRYLPLKGATQILDIATGSGDLVLHMHDINPTAAYTCVDPSNEMLAQARLKLRGKSVTFKQGFCEDLDLPSSDFDLATIGFGFRNFTSQVDALKKVYQLLKPGGTLAILEFSQSKSQIFNALYQPYATHIIPMIGSLVANNADAYQYLTESIEVHPPAEKIIKMLEETGFVDIKEHSFMTGLVRAHIAQRPHC